LYGSLTLLSSMLPIYGKDLVQLQYCLYFFIYESLIGQHYSADGYLKLQT
jgi:hypothetical protein